MAYNAFGKLIRFKGTYADFTAKCTASAGSLIFAQITDHSDVNDTHVAPYYIYANDTAFAIPSHAEFVALLDEAVRGAEGYLKIEKKDGTSTISIDSTQVQGGETTTGIANTKLATAGYVDDEVAKAIKGGVQYKGTVADTLPTGTPANGDMYKTTAKSAEGVTPTWKAGDIIIYRETGEGTGAWDVIPAGDDVEYTGIKVGDVVVISPTVGGDASFVGETGDDALISVAGAAGTVTYSSTEKLQNAVAKVESLDEDSVTVRTGSEDYIGATVNTDDTSYAVELEIKTKALGDAVGMTKGEDGKWHAATGEITTDGLVTAADTAAEIVADEQVIAAALNDHETRIQALEDAVTTTAEAAAADATATKDHGFVSVTDAPEEGSNDHHYKIGAKLAADVTRVVGTATEATGLATDRYVNDSIANALAWEVIG